MNTISPTNTTESPQKSYVPIWASLKITVPIALLIPLLSCVGVLGSIAILSGHDTAEKFKEQSMKTLNEQIQERLKNYLEEPHYINKINTNAIQQNQLKISKINTLEKHFWLQAQIFKDVNGIQFGTHEDGLLRSIVKEEDILTFNVVDPVPKRENIIYEANSKGGKGAKISIKTNYDPRNRPWYKAAVKAGTGTWTKIFAKRTSSETQLRLSAVQPVYEEGNKKLLGVLAVDFFLTQISDFLNGISENNSRAIFIIDRSGKMVASSAKIPLFVDTGDSINRIEAAQSKNKLVRDTAKEIRKQLQGFNNINEIKSIKFSTSFSNEKQLAKITPFEDDYGLDWLVIVVVPEKEFTQGVDNTTRVTIILAIATFFFCLLLGIAVTTWLIKPILRLNNAAKQIEDEEIPFEPEKIENIAKRSDEIGQLAGMFREMAEHIYAREQNLKDRVKQLHKETDKAKKAALATQIASNVDVQALLTRSQNIRDKVSNKK